MNFLRSLNEQHSASLTAHAGDSFKNTDHVEPIFNVMKPLSPWSEMSWHGSGIAHIF